MLNKTNNNTNTTNITNNTANSTIRNMIFEHIESQNNEYVLIKFNPWYFSLTVDYSVFSQNSSKGEYGGGAIVAVSGEMTITKSSFIDNYAYGQDSGGIVLVDDSTKVQTSDCTFKGNAEAHIFMDSNN